LFKARRTKDEKRFKDEDLVKVVDAVIDARTYVTLMEIKSKLRLSYIGGPLSSGKESRIYYARDDEGREYALKIFYTTTTNKRVIRRYIGGDSKVPPKAVSTRRLIEIWARREFRNLQLLSKAGVNVAKPHIVRGNILVMDFLGKEGMRFPLLKELEVVNAELYKETLNQVFKMVRGAKLVHGDLSEYNVMVFEERPYIIDVSQAMELAKEDAVEILRKDLENLNNFFSSMGVEVIQVEEIMRELLGDEY
jgi:RIO kinase 1